MTTDAASSTSPGGRADKPEKKARGEVFIDQERCKGCGYCVEFCPAHILAMSNEFNAKGHHYPEVIPEGKCMACDLCGMYCPDFAVHAERKPDQQKKE
jgi:2-oxoglutarate ferredoxin oxidoreductase subunit delta